MRQINIVPEIIAMPDEPAFAFPRVILTDWTPAILFAGGVNGIWIDPNDWSTLYQDTAGTQLVTAVGQTVGKALDKSGNGNHLRAPTDAARSILRQAVSGKYYIEFDGIDDLLTITNAFTGWGNKSEGTLFVKGAALVQAATQIFLFVSRSTSQSSTWAQLCSDNAGGRRVGADSLQQTTAIAPSTDVKRYAGVFNFAGAKLDYWVDGGIARTKNPFQSAGNTESGTSVQTSIGKGASFFYAMHVYGALIVSRALSDAEVATLSAYYA